MLPTISRALGVMLCPDPDIIECPETGGTELVPVLICLNLAHPSVASLEAGIGSKVIPAVMGGELTSRRHKEEPISRDNGGNPIEFALGGTKESTWN